MNVMSGRREVARKTTDMDAVMKYRPMEVVNPFSNSTSFILLGIFHMVKRVGCRKYRLQTYDHVLFDTQSCICFVYARDCINGIKELIPHACTSSNRHIVI